MNQNKTESKPSDAEQPTEEGLDETTCCVSSGAGYRLLKPGERLQKHDEGLHEEDGKWHEVGWLFSACDYVPGFMVPIRRKCEHCTEGYVQDAGFVECNHCNSPHNVDVDASADEKTLTKKSNV